MDHVVERSLQLEVRLDEQHRLMRLANQKLVELEAEVAKEKKGHALYKRLYEKNSKFLRTTFNRLESSSWENEVELLAILLRYGGHRIGCGQSQVFMEGKPRTCTCGWEREMIALKLIDNFNKQA